MNAAGIFFASMIFAVAATAANGAEWKQISLTSDPMFPVQTAGGGAVKITKQCVCFRISRLSLRLAKNVKTPIQLLSLRIGLAHKDKPDSWDVYGYGAPHQLGQIVAQGKTVEIGPFESSIPVPEGLANAEHWVVVEMVVPVKNQNARGTIYAYESE